MPSIAPSRNLHPQILHHPCLSSSLPLIPSTTPIFSAPFPIPAGYTYTLDPDTGELLIQDNADPCVGFMMVAREEFDAMVNLRIGVEEVLKRMVGAALIITSNRVKVVVEREEEVVGGLRVRFEMAAEGGVGADGFDGGEGGVGEV